LKEAERREQRAEDSIRRYQAKQEELERSRAQMLDEAREEAEKEKRRLLEQARDEVGEIRAQWQRQTEQEKAEFLDNLRKQAAQAVELIARQALADLADTELEQHLVHVFIDRLKALDKAARQRLAESVCEVHISSAFELDSATRSHLTRAVHEHLAQDLGVEYDPSPQLLCGIELTAGGRRLGWSLADYLEQLAERVEQSFARGRPATA
jgi:F-type H+-transporting ATPase subunit b